MLLLPIPPRVSISVDGNEGIILQASCPAYRQISGDGGGPSNVIGHMEVGPRHSRKFQLPLNTRL